MRIVNPASIALTALLLFVAAARSEQLRGRESLIGPRAADKHSRPLDPFILPRGITGKLPLSSHSFNRKQRLPTPFCPQASAPLRSEPVDFKLVPADPTKPATAVAVPVSAQQLKTAPDTQRLKPRDLRISGTNVFSATERTHDIMKNVFVVVKWRDDYRDVIDRTVETAFTEGQRIKWCPLRSARPPEYEFSGHWQLNEDGELSVSGKYVPAHGAAELPSRLRNDKEFRFRIPEVLLRAGTPPYTHSLELWITLKDDLLWEKESHKTAAAAQPVGVATWLNSPRFAPFPARYAAGDWEHEVRFSPAEGMISPYELIIRYRGQTIAPGGWCDWVSTPWGIARSFKGRWIPGGSGLGGRNDMLGLTLDELSRAKDLTPRDIVIKPATQPNDDDRLADCLRALNNPARQVQLDAARYLGRLGPGGKAGVDRLTQMIEQLDPGSLDVVGICTLVAALGRIGPDARSALPSIVKLSGHRDPNVRAETVWAVARVWDLAAEAGPFLERMAQDKEERVARAAVSAIEQVKNKALPRPAQPRDEAAAPGARADK